MSVVVVSGTKRQTLSGIIAHPRKIFSLGHSAQTKAVTGANYFKARAAFSMTIEMKDTRS